jgi:phenylpropionate dioxygenase-like ring-hydroxylating dioxygenase large terminal subunit
MKKNSKANNLPSGVDATLPSSWYLQDNIFSVEREKIFMKEWLCVGREELIPNAGDHKIMDVMGESIIVVRNTEGEVRAFYNVCRHRGSRICPTHEQQNEPESENRVPLRGGVTANGKITCPYHAWSYNLDGELLKAPHMTEEMGFDKADFGLHPVSVGTWGGFIFLNLTPETAPSFDDMIKEVANRFERYPLDSLRVGKTIRYEVNANWKVICENYNECYHCGPVHPELCRIVPAFRENGATDLDWDRGIPHREGADTFTSTGVSDRRSFPDLDTDEQERHNGELLYPNMFLSLAREHVVAFLLYPISAGRTVIECQFLFEPFEMEKPEFDPSDAVDFWHLVNRQDWGICERVQQGMATRVHDIGMFSPMEDWNLDIRRYVTDHIGEYITDDMA